MSLEPFAKYKRAFKRGTILYKSGDPGREVFIIQSGLIKLVKETANFPIILAILERGEFFGDIGVFDDSDRYSKAEVLIDAELVVIPKYDFEKMIVKNNEIAVRMLKKYSLRIKHLYQQMVKILAEDDKSRILKTVLHLMKRFGKNIEGKTVIDVPFTIQDIAGLSATPPLLTEKIMNDLISGGMIVMAEERIIFTNKEKLYKFVEYLKWRKSVGR